VRLKALAHTFKQGGAGPSLQLLHLFADGALRQVQCFGCARDAAKARGRGKSAQQVQGWVELAHMVDSVLECYQASFSFGKL
jgi:hypothetical protein